MRKRLGISEDAPVVVCTARFVKRKGQDTLVRAWPAVLRETPDALLLLVGDGPNRKHVEQLARRMGVADSVIFTGSVPWEEMPAFTDAGDVFAMPCRTRLLGLEAEAFGIVFLEAAACGLPVIAGDSGGAPEVTRQVNGLVLRTRGELQGIDKFSDAIGRQLFGGERDCPAPATPPSWAEATRRLKTIWGNWQ